MQSYYNLSQKISNFSTLENLKASSFIQVLIKAALIENEAKSWLILSEYQAQINEQFIQEFEQWMEACFTGQLCPEIPEELADLLVITGIRYLESPRGIRLCDVNIIIDFHRIALRIYAIHKDYIKSSLLRKKSAKALNSLGNVHIKCAELGIEPIKNIKDAIEHYELSATIRRQLNLEDDLSSTFNNLGRAYQLQVEQLGIAPSQNIEKSIKYYEKSVEIQRRLDLKNKLSALLDFWWKWYFKIQNDQSSKAEALDLWCISLAYYLISGGAKLSSTLNNLGNLYQIRAKILKSIRPDVESAIKYYLESAEIARFLKLDRELSLTLHNLGAAYQALAQVESAAVVRLELAINCYKEAIAIREDLGLECDLASTLNNLGTVYQTLAKRDLEATVNLDRAIAFYLEAKTIREQLGLERALAYTFSNLGAAYLQRSKLGIEPASSREKVVSYYHKALAFIKPTLFPIDCFKTARTLGDFGFYQGNWELAIDGYTIAIQAVEQIRIWAGSDQRRQEVLENAIGVYDNALQCHISLGQDAESRGEALKHYQAAILLSEQARSRYLVDLMHSNELYKGGENSVEIQKCLEEYEALQQQIDQLRQQRQNDPALSGNHLRFTLQDQETVKDTVEDLFRKKEVVWRKLRAKDPVLAGQLEVPHLDFEQLAKLIQDRPTTAIFSFYSTNDHTYIFVVRHGETGTTCDVQTCEKQGKQELQLWIAQNWLIPYKANFNTWIEQMPHRLQELAKKLQIDQLITDHLQGIEELILIPHIFLHLIPFAALPLPPSLSPMEREKKYLGDKFRLRVLPSAQILKYCHDREPSGRAPDLLGTEFGSVEDATGDRPIVASGFEQIAQLLKIPDDQRLRGPQKATLANYRQLTRNPHIRALHSIHHAGSDLRNPLESTLILANHERLTLGQLMSPGWRMPHLVEVFLSCCETNMGTPNVTDDIVTLSTGFLCAGARVVISTLWSVDALATAVFCLLYYQHRQKGCDRPAALQKAQQAMRQPRRELGKLLDTYFQTAIAQTQQSGQQCLHDQLVRLKEDVRAKIRQKPKAPLFESPFYWAGFVCQGLP